MVRALRYPRLSRFACVLTLGCALGRDICLEAAQDGWAQMLLFATFVGLGACFALLSCRLTVDETGIGVGFLLKMRHARWDELASLGALCCNSSRMYLYGTYRGYADFVNLLHMAPRCGRWGFVTPMTKKLAEGVKTYCPYPVELSPIRPKRRPRGMRLLWHQTALYALVMLPSAGVAFATCAAMVAYGARERASFTLALAAFGMFAAGCILLRRTMTTFLTCPSISEEGVSIGRGLYMPWDDVRYAFVHRAGQMSGLFFLSRELHEVSRLSAPPILCLSMPDTSTLVLAYLTYCPYARHGTHNL